MCQTITITTFISICIEDIYTRVGRFLRMLKVCIFFYFINLLSMFYLYTFSLEKEETIFFWYLPHKVTNCCQQLSRIWTNCLKAPESVNEMVEKWFSSLCSLWYLSHTKERIVTKIGMKFGTHSCVFAERT